MKSVLLFITCLLPALLTGCVAVTPQPPARLTGHVELPSFRSEQQTLVLTAGVADNPQVMQQRLDISVLPYYFDFALPRFMDGNKPIRLHTQLLKSDQKTIEAEDDRQVIPSEAVVVRLRYLPH